MSTQQYARYVGTAGRRHMPFRDWNKLGIKQKTISFTPANGFTVARSEICDEAWLIILNDPGMVVVGEQRDADALHAAAVEAAKTRLRSRQAGQQVLRRTDTIPTEYDASQDVSAVKKDAGGKPA